MRIALLVSYNGSAFSGNAFQNDNVLTVESVLLNGLRKLGYLCDTGTFKEAELDRTGRTDAGVSAECMLYTIKVKKHVPNVSTTLSSHHKAIIGLNGFPIDPHCICVSSSNSSTCLVFNLNRLMPPQLRVLGMATNIPDSFSARHSCVAREYEYILGYNIPLDARKNANSAAQSFMGTHSFHNFCRSEKDTKQVYTRQIYISEVLDRGGVCVFHVVGSAFLYHQVRYMSSILIHILTGLEKPSVIPYLLERNQAKPKRAFPLVPSQYLLFKCGWYPPPLGERSFYCSVKAYAELSLHILSSGYFQTSLLGHLFESEPLPVLHVLNINKNSSYRSLEESDDQKEGVIRFAKK